MVNFRKIIYQAHSNKIMNADILLSDKFVEFSQKITLLHEQKKKLQAEVKKLIEEHKLQLKSIEDDVAALTSDFNAWEQENTKSK